MHIKRLMIVSSMALITACSDQDQTSNQAELAQGGVVNVGQDHVATMFKINDEKINIEQIKKEIPDDSAKAKTDEMKELGKQIQSVGKEITAINEEIRALQVSYPVSSGSIPNLYNKWSLQVIKPNLVDSKNICAEETIKPLMLMAMAQKSGFVEKKFPKAHKANDVETLRWSDVNIDTDKINKKNPLEYTVAIESEMENANTLVVMKNNITTWWEDATDGRKKGESKDTFFFAEIKNAKTLSSSLKNGKLNATCEMSILVANGYRTWDGMLFTDMQDLPVTSFLPYTSDIKKQDRKSEVVTKKFKLHEKDGNMMVSEY